MFTQTNLSGSSVLSIASANSSTHSLANRPVSPSPALSGETCKAVVFQIAGYQFALPFNAIQRVVPTPPLFELGSPQLKLTKLGDRDLIVVGLHLRLTATPGIENQLSVTASELVTAESVGRFLVVIQTQPRLFDGILIDEPPVLLDLPLSAIQPFAKHHRQTSLLKMASHFVTLTQGTQTQTIFLLNLQQLKRFINH
jgi:purine-binding chemotaxis protein CheW